MNSNKNINYKLLVEKFSEGIVVAQEGRIVFVNQKLCSLVRREESDMLGCSILDFIHPEDQALVMERHKMRTAGKKPPSIYEFRLVTSSKNIVDIRLNSTKIMWDKKPATLSYITDITKIKEKEDKERGKEVRTKEFFDVAQVLIFSLSKDQKIEYINKKGCEILECKEKDVLGKNWFDNFLPKRHRKEVKGVFDLLMAGKIKPVENYENSILTFTGEEKLISWHNSILRDKNGKPTHVVSSGEDITDKKKVEEKIKESEERFRSVFENSSDAIYLKDKDLRYIMANIQMEKILNKPLSKILEKKDCEISKSRCSSVEEKLEKEVLNGKIYKGERNIIVNGEKKYFSISKTPVRDESMNVVGLSGIERDITEKKRKEKEIFLKNKFNNDILESTPIGIFVVSDKGDVEYVNKAMLKISSADYDRFITLNMFKHKQYRRLGISEKIKKALNDEEFRMNDIYYTSTMGKKTTIRNFIGVPIEEDGHKKVLLMVEDVTERVNFEQKISEQNSFLMTILDSLSYPFYVINVADYHILLANKEATKGRENISTCHDLSHNSDNPCSKEYGCSIVEIQKTKKPAMIEHLYHNTQGERRHVEVYGYPIFNKKGEVDKVIEYLIDITDKKEAESRLKEQEKKFKDILDDAHDLIQSVNMKGEIVYVNKSWKEILGYSDKEIKKLNIFNIIHTEDRPVCQKEFREIVSGKRLGNLDARFLTKKGGYIQLSGSVSCKFEKGKPLFTRGIFRDVTEQRKEKKELEKRTQELEKFNKIAVDRELKMIELKRMIRDLNKELKECKEHLNKDLSPNTNLPYISI